MNRYFLQIISKVIHYENLTLIANTCNGKWIVIPKKCYDVIDYSFQNEISLSEIENVFENTRDKVYFRKVINNLDNIGLLHEVNLKRKTWDKMSKITFSITNRCNLKCDYCCSSSDIDIVDYLSTEDCKRIFNVIVAINPTYLIISGGEPLLRTDFFQLLDYIRSIYKGKIILSTNATLINLSNIDFIIDRIDGIDISIDGFDEESVSMIRGNNVFGIVVNVIRKLKERGFCDITVSTIVGKNNIGFIDKFYEFCEKLEVNPLIRPFFSIGRGSYYKQKYLHSEYEEFFSDILLHETRYVNRCKAALNQLSINSMGEAYPCPNLEYKEFFLFDAKKIKIDSYRSYIESIYENNNIEEKVDKYKMHNLEKCNSCPINLFCTPCPAIAYNLMKNNAKFDYNCKLMKDEMMGIWKNIKIIK
ncbi:radical SAM/SPASM domain-containing protein [Peptostreptococcus porci]|uniref:radical SAM/SPASM domain-containing protein n=1 Tax=Peptostreptococcus porci TaxID=2652282 RepID=UPI002A805CF1|nr:radical SAM protein [Peptostreptococcus porci]MDY4129018.1 radical SAM protein [Peptostreptococcus porci]MDY5436435.1 radical SAM protein [Peptostreptococcus porci]